MLGLSQRDPRRKYSTLRPVSRRFVEEKSVSCHFNDSIREGIVGHTPFSGVSDLQVSVSGSDKEVYRIQNINLNLNKEFR